MAINSGWRAVAWFARSASPTCLASNRALATGADWVDVWAGPL